MGIIRLLLALSVVAGHCGSLFGSFIVGGQIAVQSFYIISGFYMSLILSEKYVGQNSSYKLFISNRFFRIYPVYWAVLLLTFVICLAVVLVTKGESTPQFGAYMSVGTNVYSFLYLIVSHLIIFGQDVVMFMGIYPDSGNLYFTSDFSTSNPPLFTFLFIPQAWTLGLELTFYLLAPFLIKRGYKWILPLMVGSFVLRLFLYNGLDLKNDPWTYRFFPTEILFFLLGYCSYQLYVKWKTRSVPKYVSIMSLVIIVAFSYVYFRLPAGRVPYLPFSIKEMAYFLMIVVSIPMVFLSMKKSKWDNQVGELSYPVYISHMLVARVFGGFPYLFMKSSYAIALGTVVFSYMLNRFIANPIDKYRQSRLTK